MDAFRIAGLFVTIFGALLMLLSIIEARRRRSRIPNISFRCGKCGVRAKVELLQPETRRELIDLATHDMIRLVHTCPDGR